MRFLPQLINLVHPSHYEVMLTQTEEYRVFNYLFIDNMLAKKECYYNVFSNWSRTGGASSFHWDDMVLLQMYLQA